MDTGDQTDVRDDEMQQSTTSATGQLLDANGTPWDNTNPTIVVAPVELVEEDSFESLQSDVIESEEIWYPLSTQSSTVAALETNSNNSGLVSPSQHIPVVRDDVLDTASSSPSFSGLSAAHTSEINRDNISSIEPANVESIEMLVMDESGEAEINQDAGDSDDPLEMSSEAEDEASVIHDLEVDVDEEAVEEEGVAEEAEVTPPRRDRFHGPPLAPVVNLHNQRSWQDRFNSLHNQPQWQLRRAIFSMGNIENRYPRITGEGDGEFQLEDADSDDRMGQRNENEAQESLEQSVPENSIRFDTNLPAEHSYLGSNMNRVSGVEYLDVGEEYSMMLFLHQHIVYPGEVLPFMISGTIIDAGIDSSNGLLFGVCFPFMCSKDNENILYGVTCQIYEKGTDARGNTLIKSRALQRFITTSDTQVDHLEYITDNPTLKRGNVRILPEIYLREPLQCIDMGSMNRFRGIASMEREFQRFQAATTIWPVHIYNYYNISSIIEKARQSLAQHKIDTMPTDPTQLSFWLARNLHLSEDMMKKIFMNDTVNLRMKLISSTFKEESIFVCRICGNRIANCRELFAMSKHGVQTQYCNSAGYIHETNTVYQVLRYAISYSGEPSSEFSWFPGYQWHIIVCKVCTRHIGWEFKAVESNLVPKSFFGISSSSVRISDSNRPPTNPREEIFRNFMRLARREVQ